MPSVFEWVSRARADRLLLGVVWFQEFRLCTVRFCREQRSWLWIIAMEILGGQA